MVRPENIALAEGSQVAGDRITWSGKIAHAVFRGSRRSIAVDTGAQRLNVEAPALARAEIGDTVAITVPPGGAWAIRGLELLRFSSRRRKASRLCLGVR